MTTIRMFVLALLYLCATGMESVSAQERPYSEGSVWDLTFARVKPGMFDHHMRELAGSYKLEMDEAQKQGFVVSHRLLAGDPANREDFSVLFLVEYKNWAAFDGLSKKFDAISQKIIGPDEKMQQIMIKRSDIREIFGDKHMQEIILK
jgi:hypothetical protein